MRPRVLYFTYCNVGVYCLRFLETAYRLLDHFGLNWIKFLNWQLQACYDLRVDAVNQIVNTAPEFFRRVSFRSFHF